MGHQHKKESISSPFLLCVSVRDALLWARGGVENRFEFQAVKPSCPSRKALIMLFRGELSEGR